MLGDKLRYRLEQLEMTQADLARKTGLSTGHVSDLVNGIKGKRLSIGTMRLLIDALSVPEDFFYTDNSHMGVPNANSRSQKGAA